MKILIKLRHSPERRYFVRLKDKSVIKRVMDLVNDGKRSNAIVAAFLNSEVIREVGADEIADTETDLIITEKNVWYNIV